jgi:hypothetical protein
MTYPLGLLRLHIIGKTNTLTSIPGRELVDPHVGLELGLDVGELGGLVGGALGHLHRDEHLERAQLEHLVLDLADGERGLVGAAGRGADGRVEGRLGVLGRLPGRDEDGEVVGGYGGWVGHVDLEYDDSLLDDDA